MTLSTRCSVASRLVLIVASMTLPPSFQGQQLFRCYKCVTFEGFSDPRCEFPVRRKAPNELCYGDPKDTVTAKCGKMVIFSKSYKEGQTLKSWFMQRACVLQIDIEQMYDNLTLPCNSCGRGQNQASAQFPRFLQQVAGWHPQNSGADKIELIEFFICVCCEYLCNAEEGFDLRYFNNIDRNSGSESHWCNVHYCLMILVSFVSHIFMH